MTYIRIRWTKLGGQMLEEIVALRAALEEVREDDAAILALADKWEAAADSGYSIEPWDDVRAILARKSHEQ